MEISSVGQAAGPQLKAEAPKREPQPAQENNAEAQQAEAQRAAEQSGSGQRVDTLA